MTAILIIEDEPDIADLLRVFFNEEGWSVSHALDAERGLKLFRSRDFDLVVLDIGLPGGKTGYDVCREIRGHNDVPVMFLTARDEEVDKLLGLELGADDYVLKPFSGREVVARVKAILRRGRSDEASRSLHYGEVEIDLGGRRVLVKGKEVDLAAKELSLLLALADSKGVALSREQLLDIAWGDGWVGDIRTIDVHVRHLRKKIGDELPLGTVRGFGYRLD